MKSSLIAFFMFATGTASICHAALSFNGSVVENQGSLYVEPSTTQACTRYLFVPKNNEVALHLRKLSAGDFVEASGLLEAGTCKAQVESIEYVGLKKLLGYWFSRPGIVSIPNFNSMNFYPNQSQRINTPQQNLTTPINYRYSVTPSGGKEWVVFLSSAEGTLFGTITFSGKIVVMKFFDSDTGAVTQTLRLSKWVDVIP